MGNFVNLAPYALAAAVCIVFDLNTVLHSAVPTQQLEVFSAMLLLHDQLSHIK
jgi:hypothetical protein